MSYYKTELTSSYYIERIQYFLDKYDKASNGEYVFYDEGEKSLLENVSYVEGYKKDIIGALRDISDEDIQKVLLTAILVRYRALSEKSFPKHYFARSWLEFPHFQQLEKDIQTEYRKSFKNPSAGSSLSELNYILMNAVKLTDEQIDTIVKEMYGTIFLSNLSPNSGSFMRPTIQLVRYTEDGDARYTNVPLSALSYYDADFNLFEQIVELTDLAESLND